MSPRNVLCIYLPNFLLERWIAVLAKNGKQHMCGRIFCPQYLCLPSLSQLYLPPQDPCTELPIGLSQVYSGWSCRCLSLQWGHGQRRPGHKCVWLSTKSWAAQGQDGQPGSSWEQAVDDSGATETCTGQCRDGSQCKREGRENVPNVQSF